MLKNIAIYASSYLNNDVNSELSPRELERVPVRDNLDELTIDRDGLVVHYFHVCFKSSKQ